MTTDTQPKKRHFSWRIFLCSLLVLNNFVIIINNFHAKADNNVVITFPGPGQTLTDANPTITGTASPNKNINIKLDNNYIGIVQSDNNGNWAYQVHDLTNAPHSIQASITDGTAIFGSQKAQFQLVKTSINKPSIAQTTTTDAKISAPFKTVFSADSSRAYIADQQSNKINVVDTNSKAILASIALDGQPSDIALSDSRGKLYISLANLGKIDVINTSDLTANITSFTVLQPISKLVLSSDNINYYAVCGNYNAICYGGLDQNSNSILESPLNQPYGWPLIYQLIEVSPGQIIIGANSRQATGSYYVGISVPSGATTQTVTINGSNSWNPGGVSSLDSGPISLVNVNGASMVAIADPQNGGVWFYLTSNLSNYFYLGGVGSGPYELRTLDNNLYVYSDTIHKITNLSLNPFAVISQSPTLPIGNGAFTGMRIAKVNGNPKIYISSSANPPNTPNAKIDVFNPTSNTITNTVQMSSEYGVYPFVQPDNQQLWLDSIYASTIKVVSTQDDSISSTIYNSPNTGNILLASPDGSVVYTNGATPYDFGRIRKLNATTGTELGQIQIGSTQNADFKLSRDGSKIVAYNNSDQSFTIISTTNMNSLGNFTQNFDCNKDYDINQDASKIYCGDNTGAVRVYDTSGNTIANYTVFGPSYGQYTRLLVSADGQFIYLSDSLNLYKYNTSDNSVQSSPVDSLVRQGSSSDYTVQNMMVLNPTGSKLYLGGGPKIEVFDVAGPTLTHTALMTSSPSSPHHDLSFSNDGKRAFMAYSQPIDGHDGMSYSEFDTQDDIYMGDISLETTPLTGSSIVLLADTSVVESTTVSFSVNQPVIFDTNGSLNYSVNFPINQAIPVKYAHGTLSVSLVSGSLPPGVNLGLCDPNTPCLTGTITTTGTYQFTANISDGITNSDKAFTLVVDKGGRFVNPNNDFSLQLPSAVIGQSYSTTMILTGPTSVVSDVILGLPTGLQWAQDQNDPTKVTVSGTVDPGNSLGQKCFVLTAFDNYNHNNQQFCINVIATPISITTTSLPDGTFASSYNQTIATAGGDGAKSFSVTAGNLPPGLNLDSHTGVLSGAPSDHNAYTFTITVTDLSGSASQGYTLNIQSGNNPNAAITTTSLHAGQINMPYNGFAPQTKIESAGFNNLQSWSITDGDLPPGMTLTSNGSSALIDGTPTAAGNFTFTVTTADGVNNQVKQFTISIRPATPPPTKTQVTITSPTDGASLGGGNQLVTGTVSPAGAVVQVSIDGQSPYDVPSNTAGAWSFSADGLSSGAHQFTASVKQVAREYAYIASSYYPGSITIIDTKTDNVVGQLNLPSDVLQLGANEFAGAGTVWADPSGKLAYIGGAILHKNDASLAATYIAELDTTTNTITRALRLNGQMMYSGAFDYAHHMVYAPTISVTSNERSIQVIDLSAMQVVRQKIDTNLGGYDQNFTFAKATFNSDGSKIFLPNSGSSFVNVINTSDLTVSKIEVGFASFEITPINNQYVVLPALANLTPNPPIAFLNNDGTLAQQTNINTQGSSVIVRYWLSSRDGQTFFNRATVAGDNGGPNYSILIRNPASTDINSSPLAILATRDWGMGMAQTHDGKKVYLINTADSGWGSVDVFDTTTNQLLAGTKYPIPVSLGTYSPGQDWISAIPATTFSVSRNITVYGGVDNGNGSGTINFNEAYSNFIRYIQQNWPNIDVSVIKPFDIPGFDFHNRFNIPKINPVNGWGNDQNVSKTNAGLVGNIIGALKTGVSLVPAQVALTFPYLILLVLIIMILSLLAQTRDELDKARQIKHIIAKRKSLEEERNNFIGLISHYLNTPISMMQGGVDLIATLARAPREMTDGLQKTLKTLSQKVKSLLTSTAQTSTDRPDKTKLPRMVKPYKSFVVMAPVVLVGIMTALTNWLLNSAGVADLSVINIFTQIMAFALLLQALFATYKYHQTAKNNLATAQASLDRETTMASARLHFLSGSVDELKAEISGLRRNLPGLAAAPNAKAVKDGYARLQSILGRLQLLTEIEQDQHHGEITSFSVRRSIDNVLSQYQPQLATRGIAVDIKVPKTLSIKQDRQMLELVISSLIDNAIKFVPKRDGTIAIKVSVVRGKIKLAITDNGAGIAKNKINQLFKPFSRAETALRFNYEGLGLSLYLDKIIIEKLGGEIAISSHKGEGTQVTLTLNPSQKFHPKTRK